MGHAIGTETTYTGNPASFTGVSGSAVTGLSASMVPSQSYNGYSKPWAAGAGTNVIDSHLYSGIQYNPTVGSTVTLTDNPTQFTDQGSGVFSVTSSVNWTYYVMIAKISDDANWWQKIGIASDGILRTSMGCLDENYVILNKLSYSDSSKVFNNAITTPTGAEYYYFVFSNASTTVATITVTEPQVEQGTAATSYVPYENICPITGTSSATAYVSPTTDPNDATTYTTNWSGSVGTVYGGTIDFVTGVLTVTMGSIASYAGETIGEPWLSSRDEYVSGATPTTGAQVVYTLSTPLTYQLGAQEVDVLVGTNKVWASTNQNVSISVMAPMTGFAGWLVKAVTNGTPVEIPLKYIRAETYHVTPDQRMEWSAERDVTGVLHRETVQNMPPKVEFNTPLMTNTDIVALNTIIQAAFTNELQRSITIQFYDPEKNQYWEWDCYMPDVKYSIRMVDATNHVIHYEELRYAFIGY